MYRPFESGLPGPTGRVYHHEIPGGQLSNLRQQAIALGLGDQFERVEDWYAEANRILGRPPKVTPSSKVVGDLALQLAAADADPSDFEQHPENYDIPDSVVGFLSGELGDPPGGWPEPFRTKALKGRTFTPVPEFLEDGDATDLRGESVLRRATLNRLLFPAPTEQFLRDRELYGNVGVLETHDYLYGLRLGNEHVIHMNKGVSLFVTLEAVSEPDDKGFRTVMATLNGQMRPLLIRDTSIQVTAATAVKADRTNPLHIGAPFLGVVTLQVEIGDVIPPGGTIATIEAMKMEASITSAEGGIVHSIAIPRTQQVELGDLLVILSKPLNS
jgi:pyruvate carboxylase